MPAPEIGQAEVRRLQQEAAMQPAAESNNVENPNTEPPAPPAPPAPPQAPPVGLPDQPPGTLSLDVLPDEDLKALAASQKIELTNAASRDAIIKDLHAKQIFFVLAQPPAPPAT